MSFISYLINGVSLGSIYAIIALGYTMVYGIAKMLNFAHGDVIMIGCYIVFVLMGSFHYLHRKLKQRKLFLHDPNGYLCPLHSNDLR